MSQKQSGRSATGVRNAPAKAPAAPVQEKTFGQSAIEWTKSLAMGFVLFIILRTFLIQTFTITSGSMEGTLLVGDFLVLSKSAYGATVPGTRMRLPGYTDPNRGDIIVFRGHHEPIDLVKRLVGMPGDTLAMHAGVLYRNGQAQTEPYARHTYPSGDGTHEWMVWQSNFLVDSVDRASYNPTRDNWGPLVVPPAKYFAMGDNRDESLDSRYWGFVEEHEIKGKAVILYFSYDSSGATSIGPVPILSHVRWNRIGDRLR
jgi:signal peptidase I